MQIDRHSVARCPLLGERGPRLRAAILIAATMGIQGCGGGGGDAASPASGPSVPSEANLSGAVLGGQAPIVAATVSLYAAGTTPTQAASLVASTTTDSAGRFFLNSACTGSLTPTALLYLVSSGGNPGGGVNTASQLVAVLGPCASAAQSVVINELTTVAAGYAVNGFIATPAAASDPVDLRGGSPALDNAMATSASLADAGSGAANTLLAAGCGNSGGAVNCEAVRRINSLANSLAACVNSSNAGSTQCAELFDCATAGAVFSGNGSCSAGAGSVAPQSTFQAVTSIAASPGLVSLAGLFDLAGRNPVFAPVLTTAPADWTLSLNYASTDLSSPTAIAIDAKGNPWIANYNNRVVELSPTGVALSPAGGFTGGGLNESFGIAVDAQGNVWVTNAESPGAFNSGLGSVTELGANGSILSGPNGDAGGGLDFPESVAIDSHGTVWTGNYGNSTVTTFTPQPGQAPVAAGYGGAGINFPTGIAFDPAGNLWIANSGSDSVSEVSGAGAPLSPTSGFTGGGQEVPQGIAVDLLGNVWISNFQGASVTELSPQGTPDSPSSTSQTSGGYAGGGIMTPGGIAIDGANRVWIANYHAASISELAGSSANSPGMPQSPASGFAGAGLAEPFAPAIDASGNLWVANFANDSVTKFIGIATPVTTPLIGSPRR